MAKVSKKAKRRLTFLFMLLFVIIAALFTSTYKDWKQILDNKKEVKQLTKEYEKLLSEEEALNSEVTKFQDPDYIARYAREKYLYSLPDELIIRIPKKN